MNDVKFVWVTDGNGWNRSRLNLEDAYDSIEHLYTIKDLEDGILNGGFGEKIASFYGDSNMKVKNYGLKKKFYDRYNPEDLLKEEGIDIDSIIKYIEKNI